MIKGIVTKSTGNWYLVRLQNNDIISARIAGKLKLNELKLTNPVAVGDYVELEMEAESNQGMIRKIMPRKNYIIRQSPRKKYYSHFMAANVDQVLLISTITNPNLKLGFLDRFLMMTEPYNIPAILVFNKSDLYGDYEMEVYHQIKDIYESIGYKTILVSAIQNFNVDALKNEIYGKISVIGGQSGVGKSTLLNAIFPSLDLKTNEISDFSGKGQHTTTFAEMFDIDDNSKIIDTPGIKSLSFLHYSLQDVSHNFKEIFKKSHNCKFSNCLHRNEPKCAVIEAVLKNEIAESRYMNYISLLEEIEQQKYWEIIDDI